jgi:chorismate synthase
MKVTVRPLEGPREFELAEEVQMSAWGMGPRGATPKEIMIAVQDNGGLVLGAFHGPTMVGFALLVVGYAEGRTYLYSHMTGVSKEYQSKGVGYLLKQKQREVSLERGFDMIAWTFDPIISRNARFNFRKLGVVARNYLVNYYGPMDDAINFGWDTDRFLCEWYLRTDRLDRIRAFERRDLRGAFEATRKGGEEPFPKCLDWNVDLGAREVLVDIPSDVVKLKGKSLEEARRWRTATREVFQAYFGAGFTAVSLLEHDKGFRYLLVKARLPANPFSHPK